MLEAALTRHITHIKSPNKGDMAIPISEQFAVNCTNELFRHFAEGETQANTAGKSNAIRDLIHHSISDNTRIAYQTDIKHFTEWGGHLPASPMTVAAYIAAFSDAQAVTTITRRVATLSKAHQAIGAENPCRSELVKATLQGLRRKRGVILKQAKALTREDLFAILDHMGDSTKDARDRALLLLGFAGAFRRSELVGLNVADIEIVRQGVIVTLRRSKTDQEGAGRKIGIPHGRTRHCPVAALTDWLARSGITESAIFRPITRHGQLQPERLSGDAVSEVIRERLAAAGIDPESYSGHSLRAGFATSAAQAGASTIKIRQQTGHASDAMLSRYIRDEELFVGNAVGFGLLPVSWTGS